MVQKNKNKKIHLIRILTAVILSLLSFYLASDLEPKMRITLAIFILSALLWMTDAIPLFVTSLIIPILLIVTKILPATEAFTPFFDPVIVLFLGGLLIAQAIINLKLDKWIADKFSSKAKTTFGAIFLLMIITAFLSMWISNTAATAIMIPIGLAFAHSLAAKDKKFSICMVLAIAFASNLGGMGTIVGSPPNALTVGLLKNTTGIEISFLKWMLLGIPLIIILLPITFYILIKYFKIKKIKVKPQKQKTIKLSGKHYIFIIIFIFTVLAWLTTSLHGISSTVIALSCAVVLFLFQFLDEKDLSKINWAILLLFGGGIVLGKATTETGLALHVAEDIGKLLTNQPEILIIYGAITFAILLGAFASNTVTAGILVPLMIPLSSFLTQVGPGTLELITGLAVSLDFILPVGTPPNALAYATGLFNIKTMIKVGSIVTIISILIFGGIVYIFW